MYVVFFVQTKTLSVGVLLMSNQKDVEGLTSVGGRV